MPIIFLWATLIFIWMLAVFSISISQSFKLTTKLGNPSNYYYFFTQAKGLLIALFLAFVIYKFVKIETIRKYRKHIFILFLLFQLAVFIPGVWIDIGWARGWINVWISTIQPVEFFKIGWVLFLSYWLVKKEKEIKTLQGYLSFTMIVWLISVIFLLIPDLGSLFIISFVSLLMYRYQGWKTRYIWVSIIWFLILTFTVWMQFDYIKKRLNYFINPSSDTTSQWAWFQVEQWLIAIWWGWIFWKWYWKWLQKFSIPVAQSDYIFWAFSEEIWFVGNMFLLALYFGLLYICLKRLPYVSDPYFKLVALGLTWTIVIQALVNIGVNVRLFPVTGLTLPFISHWWSWLMANCIQIILLYKILYRK